MIELTKREIKKHEDVVMHFDEYYKYEFTYTSDDGKLIAYNNADRDFIYRMSLFGDMTIRALVDEGFYIVHSDEEEDG